MPCNSVREAGWLVCGRRGTRRGVFAASVRVTGDEIWFQRTVPSGRAFRVRRSSFCFRADAAVDRLRWWFPVAIHCGVACKIAHPSHLWESPCLVESLDRDKLIVRYPTGRAMLGMPFQRRAPLFAAGAMYYPCTSWGKLVSGGACRQLLSYRPPRKISMTSQFTSSQSIRPVLLPPNSHESLAHALGSEHPSRYKPNHASTPRPRAKTAPRRIHLCPHHKHKLDSLPPPQ